MAHIYLPISVIMLKSDNEGNSKEYIFILSRLTTSVESLRFVASVINQGQVSCPLK